ncbi:aftiphilin [Calliphora vicina]|uniref:aftiphilin n=1 Tax=Calliphora vicina TaxID=7373 RepID=UPI00325AFDBC
MVNVPPIPPLLCSTPPPIDFGEDDEDVDVLPPTLEGVDDDDFGDFRTVDDIKTNEPLPSPRPPSVCDLPPVSIYDGLAMPDEEELTNHTTSSSPPPIDNKIRNDSNNTTKSKHITEAFNFDVKNTHDDTESSVLEEECKNPPIEFKTKEQTVQNVLEIESNKLAAPNSQTECPEDQTIIHSGTLSTSKNIKDLSIETSNVETKYKSNKTSISCMQNMVSIEDIEDDLSDDELYSPKQPKNFVETDNLSDYFKIEEVKTTNNAGNDTKFDSKDVDDKSLDSLDNNNESASLGNDNDNEFKSFSSNSFIQNNFDMPPPLQDDTNSIDDDDFGDFADFQDFSTAGTPAEIQNFVNNTVPVNDINNKQHNNNDLEFNGFTDFNNYTTTKEEYTDVNTADGIAAVEDTNDIENNKFKDSEEEEFDQFTSHATKVADKLEEKSKQNSLEIEIASQEISHDNYNDFNEVETTVNTSEDFEEISPVNENVMPMEETSINKNNSFGEFNSASETNDHDDDFGNFAEFPEPSQNLENINAAEASYIEEPMEVSKDISNDDEEFDDFADFESHEVKPKTEEEMANETAAFSSKDDNNVIENVEEEDDDDDFGDFNTAQPITPTAVSLTLTKTSQNPTAATPALPSSHNLNERISKILQLMFTPAINQADDTADEPKTNKIQDIPFTSIDAAKALEYQWLNSDTRHSFIRSLGIDSRNILFGENWNPSLPRFAANLSFNPLKPMKPVQSSNSTAESSSILEPISMNTSESTKTLEVTGNIKKETLEIDWKSSSTAEQTTEAFKENTITSAVTSTAATSMPYVSNEPPPAEPVSLTIFENPLDNEEKFSKTPPISEMESVTTFSTALPTTTMDKELPATQNNANNLDDFTMNDVEETLKNTLNISEVVVTSTFTGSFKETHIYTPPKTNDFETKHTQATATTTTSTSPTKVSPIDFDYEKAAMGVIIDETVVKKEYRDVEYNPPFTMESLSKSVPAKTDFANTNANANILCATDAKISATDDDQEFNDDFSEFQSVPSEVNLPTVAAIAKPIAVTNAKPLEVPRTTTVSHGGMILSPAILIPQAISMENQKPKIEWGDSTATINPEELARIEELFPEPKSLKSSNGSNSSQKSTPTHQVASTPSISATVANMELEGNINNLNDDDDDWSDFVSVTVTNNGSAHRSGSNNNNLGKSPAGSPFKQRSPVVNHRLPPSIHNNSNNDDEWSEFVSSAPPTQQPPSYRVPQFNSGAWQNANFYNNPLSMYHKGPFNVPTATASTHPAQKSLYNNNNNYNISQQPYQIANNIPPVMLGNNQQTPNNAYQQQIHVMQNFSTAPVPTPERLSAAAAAAKNNQFQSIGSAKVAPSIALIPDLGFVAPAIPTHTSFINSLPKPSINTKK